MGLSHNLYRFIPTPASTPQANTPIAVHFYPSDVPERQLSLQPLPQQAKSFVVLRPYQTLA